MPNILLFQRELRVKDNNLIKASVDLKEEFVPIFIFDKYELKNIKNKKSKNINFLVEAVLKLKQDLKSKNLDLYIFYGNKYKILLQLFKVFNSQKVIVGNTYEPDIKNLYLKLEKKLEVIKVKDSFLTDFNIKKENGEIYKVFTPYKKVFLKKKKVNKKENKQINFSKIKNSDFSSLLKKYKLTFLKENSSEKILRQLGFEKVDLGEFQVNLSEKKFNDFFKNKINEYSKIRDYPFIDGTSKFSPYFRYGLISIEKCFLKCLKNIKVKSVKVFLSELIWREFYATIVYHFPEILKQEFITKYKNLKWSYDKKKLNLWKDGKTGFPIIDAGMRQLKKEGWMHNRVRMIVSSFLTKNLLIDWRLGEQHFANYLVDYESSSNVGGWQWSASVGVDPQPYFRIFNPLNQSKKFDEKAKYIKKYIKELEGLNEKEIFSEDNIKNYYKKIVNYKKSREIALNFFKKNSS